MAAIVAILAVAGTASAASDEVKTATSLVVTMLGIALLVWILGNLLTYYRYDSGGPKGGPLQKQ